MYFDRENIIFFFLLGHVTTIINTTVPIKHILLIKHKGILLLFNTYEVISLIMPHPR